MIITIGGLIGSGKSTLAKAITREFGFRHISAGEIFREMAKERGISIIELGKLAEKDPEIDEEIDKRQVAKAKGGSIVIDGRLSGHLIDADIKTWLRAPLEIRAKRVAGRESVSINKALKDIKRREEMDIERYKKIYGIDLRDLSIYDIVLNTDLLEVDEMVKIFMVFISKFKGETLYDGSR